MERAYEQPTITDLGTLADLTQGSQPLDIGDNQGLGVGGGFAGSVGPN